MKRFVLMGILVSFCSLWAQYVPIFSQPYSGIGQGFTSTISTAGAIDYEVADNFTGLTDPISKLSFWGLCAAYTGAWNPGHPAPIEPFKIRFYDLQQEWTQPPQQEPGVMAPVTGLYTVNLYDSYGDGWNGGKLNVYVNDQLVLVDLTLGAGSGSATHTFPANAGDEIKTVYLAGSWAYENWYEILNPDLSLLAQDGDDTQTAPPTGIGTIGNPPLIAPMAGSYTVTLYDSYGDGWNGGRLNVYVNGLPVLTDLTIESGFGPQIHVFPAQAGDEIVTIYRASGWPEETSYDIFDPLNNLIAHDGNPPTGIGFLSTPYPLEPDWANPLYSFDVNVTGTYVEPWTNWYVYKFDAVLPAEVNLPQGMVSVQMDANNGSGIWFLWFTSDVGDDTSYQRDNSRNSGPQSHVMLKQKPFPEQDAKDLAPVGHDLAFDLFTGTPTEIVISDPEVALPAGVTVTAGGDIPPALVGPDAGEPAVLYTIEATGIWDVTVYKPTGWAGDWYCWIQAGANLNPAGNPIPAATPSWTFTGIDFGAKAPATIVINDNQTLPVELSSFTATLTADMLVKIAWVTQSETNHLGYNILRGMEAGIGTAIQINSSLISEGDALGTQISYSYADAEVEIGSTYHYWLESVDLGGISNFYGPLSVLVSGQPDDPGAPDLPAATKLMNAFPNPFNPSTTLRYALKEAGKVRVEIYNLKGQLIRGFDRDHSAPGYYQISWDGTDAQGQPVSSGVYMYRMSSGRYHSSKKMVLTK